MGIWWIIAERKKIHPIRLPQQRFHFSWQHYRFQLLELDSEIGAMHETHLNKEGTGRSKLLNDSNICQGEMDIKWSAMDSWISPKDKSLIRQINNGGIFVGY